MLTMLMVPQPEMIISFGFITLIHIKHSLSYTHIHTQLTSTKLAIFGRGGNLLESPRWPSLHGDGGGGGKDNKCNSDHQ